MAVDELIECGGGVPRMGPPRFVEHGPFCAFQLRVD